MKFIESSHKYTDGISDFVPVTYLIKQFQEKQDWDKIAEKKAKKDGITKEELLAQWADKRDKAALKGTNFHKMMEQKYQTAPVMEVEGDQCQVKWIDTIDGVKEDQSLLLEDNHVYTEKMIWSNVYKVCGTADLVEVVKGKINIKDYKTNEKMEFESWTHPNPAIGKRKLLSPFNNLDDCNFNIYQIQLNVYMWMLLRHNRHLKIGKMEILHILFDDNDQPVDTIAYKVDNLQPQIATMLKKYFGK